MKKRLFDLAAVIRSKNSGPFELTLDIFFEDRAVYEAVKASDAFDRGTDCFPVRYFEGSGFPHHIL